NPLIVQDTTDIDGAVHHALQSAFLSAGQRCTCARRLLVPKGKKGDEFLNRLVAVSSRAQVGEFDASPQPFMGSVISVQAAEKLLAAQKDMLAQGARPLLEMKQIRPDTGLLSP